MAGFVNLKIPLMLRRGLTMIPALGIIAAGMNTTNALVLSQVVLSFGIPARDHPARQTDQPQGRPGRPRQQTRHHDHRLDPRGRDRRDEHLPHLPTVLPQLDITPSKAAPRLPRHGCCAAQAATPEELAAWPLSRSKGHAVHRRDQLALLLRVDPGARAAVGPARPDRRRTGSGPSSAAGFRFHSIVSSSAASRRARFPHERGRRSARPRCSSAGIGPRRPTSPPRLRVRGGA